MTEIEQIILQEICGNKEPGGYTEQMAKDAKRYAKAIEQYVIKAIPDLKVVDHSKPDFVSNNIDACYGYNECIVELKQPLTQEE
jgi:hypothetical protein